VNATAAAAMAAALLLGACTAPRSVTYSPQAAAKGEWRVGADFAGNLPTQTSEALYGGLKEGVLSLYDRAASGQTVPITADSLNDLAKALFAFSLDPLGLAPDLFIRYGVWPRLDAGYRNSAGAHIFDARWQFLGPTVRDAGPPRWAASVGAQFSTQSYDLPSVFGLDKLQDLLKFEFTRKDFLFPFVVGKPLGPQGRYGDFGMGLAYDLALIHYGSEILKLVEENSDGSTKPFEKLEGDPMISAYGGFANLRLGYRFVYAVAALSIYYQDYGTFPLFGGRSASLAGWTFLPSLGFEFRI
jgi:hypothetical protein